MMYRYNTCIGYNMYKIRRNADYENNKTWHVIYAY